MRLSQVVAGIDAGEVEPMLTEAEIEERIMASHQIRRNRSRGRIGTNFSKPKPYKPYVFTKQQIKDAETRSEAERVELESLGRDDW